MSFLIRPADFQDKEDLLELSHFFPLCSLPKNSLKLKKKLEVSQESFKGIRPKEERNYIFVLEDQKAKKVIGSSQILSYFGPHQSLCYFLKTYKKNIFLELKKISTGQNQIGGLIVHPAYRKKPSLLGLQIGLTRFLYIKSFPKDFSSLIEVSLTAPFTGSKNEFWKETGQKQLKISYSSALKKLQTDRLSFYSLFPKKLKIPLSQLSEKAQNCLQEVHPQTYPALTGLLKRGFQASSRRHILDGGIYLEAFWRDLPFLKKAKSLFLKKDKKIKGSAFLLSQNSPQGFNCQKVLGQLSGNRFLIQAIPRVFSDKKKVLALKFP